MAIVDEKGVIVAIETDSDDLRRRYEGHEDVRWDGEGRFWFPGFVGT